MLGITIFLGQLFELEYIIKLVNRWWEEKKLKNKESFLTQKEANDLFEGQTLYMTNTLASAGNIILTSFFFSPILPFSFLFGFADLTILYWVNKYILLKRAKRPETLSLLIKQFLFYLLPLGIFLWALSFFLFYRVIFKEIFFYDKDLKIYEQKVFPAIICFGITSVYLLIKIIWIIVTNFKKKLLNAQNE